MGSAVGRHRCCCKPAVPTKDLRRAAVVVLVSSLFRFGNVSTSFHQPLRFLLAHHNRKNHGGNPPRHGEREERRNDKGKQQQRTEGSKKKKRGHQSAKHLPAGGGGTAPKKKVSVCVCVRLMFCRDQSGVLLCCRDQTRISACSMENDFVDVFPSAGGVGDSPVKGLPGSSSSRPALSLSIPTGLESGGREALVSPAVTEGLGKESRLRSARAVSEASEVGVMREDDVVMLDTPSESPSPAARGVGLMPLTIEAGGGECVPTELEKKRAKLEKYRYECSEVGGRTHRWFLWRVGRARGEFFEKRCFLVGRKKRVIAGIRCLA